MSISKSLHHHNPYGVTADVFPMYHEGKYHLFPGWVSTIHNFECEQRLSDKFGHLSSENILEWEKVEILNINNGERFQTYAIKGARGSKCFCLNGAAARKAQPGDKIIIVTYAELTPEEIKTHKPTIVQVGEGNSIVRQ